MILVLVIAGHLFTLKNGLNNYNNPINPAREALVLDQSPEPFIDYFTPSNESGPLGTSTFPETTLENQTSDLDSVESTYSSRSISIDDQPHILKSVVITDGSTGISTMFPTKCLTKDNFRDMLLEAGGDPGMISPDLLAFYFKESAAKEIRTIVADGGAMSGYYYTSVEDYDQQWGSFVQSLIDTFSKVDLLKCAIFVEGDRARDPVYGTDFELSYKTLENLYSLLNPFGTGRYFNLDNEKYIEVKTNLCFFRYLYGCLKKVPFGCSGELNSPTWLQRANKQLERIRALEDPKQLCKEFQQLERVRDAEKVQLLKARYASGP